jgi:hypothetical protein
LSISPCSSIIDLDVVARDPGGEKVPHAFTNDVSREIAQPSPSTIVTSQRSPNPSPESSPHLASSIPEYPPGENEMLAELKTSTEQCCGCLCGSERGAMFGFCIGDIFRTFMNVDVACVCMLPVLEDGSYRSGGSTAGGGAIVVTVRTHCEPGREYTRCERRGLWSFL